MKQLFFDPELRFNEILFEHRNKAYGAYDLRTESNRILAKSLFLSLAVIAGVSLTAMLVSPKAAEITETGGLVIEVENVDGPDIDEPLKPEPVKPIVKPAAPVVQDIKTFDGRELTPTRNADDSKLDTKIPDDALAGVKDNLDGKVIVQDNQPVINLPTSTDTGSKTTDLPVTKPNNEVVDGGNLSVAADFVGGINSFRNKVIDKFDTSNFENESLIATTITFIVERDGSISGIKADGQNAEFNKEAIRTIMSIKGKWSPGKDKSGNIVRSYFKFPIKMKFDQ
jgi:protein TonB